MSSVIKPPTYDAVAKQAFKTEKAFRTWFAKKLNNPPRVRPNFSKVEMVSERSDDGKQITVRRHRRWFSGNPVFNRVDGHEIDSEWIYPEINPKVFKRSKAVVRFGSRFIPAAR